MRATKVCDLPCFPELYHIIYRYRDGGAMTSDWSPADLYQGVLWIRNADVQRADRHVGTGIVWHGQLE